MYKERLKQAGYKLTMPREELIDFLSKHQAPIAAIDIYQALKKQMDKVTVYRVLEVLEKVGIVFRETIDEKNLYYLAEEEHHHIVCRQCSHIECVPCNHFKIKVSNFKNIKHNLSLSGLCKKCAS